MRELNTLVKRIYDDEDFRDEIQIRFMDAVATDSETMNFRRIATQYLDNENRRELIDDIFISLCGWSFKTLVERTAEFLTDTEGDNDE